MNLDSKFNVFSNFLWRFSERILSKALMVFVTIILARLLEPSVFGVVALITVFTSIMQVFIDSGLGSALIQKKDADDLDFSSVFFFNMVICLVLYMGMYVAAPFIANFYRMTELTPVIRIISLILVISGVRNIQQAYVSRYLLFKNFFYATLGGTISGAIIGIWMAYEGYGVWAIVIQSLLTEAIGTIILWYSVAWRPKLIFSLQRLKGLLSYGWKLLVSSLIATGYQDLTSLIIGKLYTPSDLAFYERGRHFPQFITANIDTSINNVLFPAMSAQQDDRERMRSMTRRAISTSTYLIMPLMMLLAVCAEPIVRLVLTEKWLPCVFFMRIYCFSLAFLPIHTTNLNAIKALGRSDLFLKLEIIKKIVGLLALYATMYISVKAMALSLLVTTFTSQIINSWPNRKLLDYHYLDQVKDMLPQIILSCLMGIIVYCVQFLHWNDWLTLFVQAIIGAFIYIFASWLLQIESFKYLLGIVKVISRNNKTFQK